MFWQTNKQKPIFAASVAVTIQAGATDNATATPTFRSVAYTGGPLRVGGYPHPVIVDLAGLTQRSKVIANLDHDSKKRVGQITDVKNDGKSLILGGSLSASTPSRDEVLQSHKDGWQWELSIETLPTELETVKAGETVSVNGKTFQGPVLVARKSQLFGVSFVTQGADSDTSVSIAAELDSETEPSDEPTFESWLASKGFDLAELSEEQKMVLTKAYEDGDGSNAKH